ncbi:hypothetical protein [Ectobacillus funiculus]|uniref:MFS transporter n=2 Tax=Ectobacillus funiculus TaxID=137993 RepID=A0ABV5WHZ9_9BACI
MAQHAKTIVTETTAENTNFRKFGMKDKIGYLLGDFGNDFFFILVASFLMV